MADCGEDYLTLSHLSEAEVLQTLNCKNLPKLKDALCSKHLLPYAWEPSQLPRCTSTEDKPQAPKKVKILKPIRTTKASIISQLKTAKRLEKKLKAGDKPGTRRISASNIAQRRSDRVQALPYAGTELGSGKTKKEFFQLKPETGNGIWDFSMACVKMNSSVACAYWEPYPGFTQEVHGSAESDMSEYEGLKVGIGAEVFCPQEVLHALGKHAPATLDDEVFLDPSWALPAKTQDETIQEPTGDLWWEEPAILTVDLEAEEEALYCRPQPLDHNYAFMEPKLPTQFPANKLDSKNQFYTEDGHLNMNQS